MTENFSVIIPVRNNEKIVESCLKELQQSLESFGVGYQIIVVDDGSSDTTFEKVEKMSKVNVIKLKKKYGSAEALKAGINSSKYENVILVEDIRYTSFFSQLKKPLQDFSTHKTDLLNVVFETKKSCFLTGLKKKVETKFLNGFNSDKYPSIKIVKKDQFDDIKLFRKLDKYLPALVYINDGKVVKKEVKVGEGAVKRFSFGSFLPEKISLLTVSKMMKFKEDNTKIYPALYLAILTIIFNVLNLTFIQNTGLTIGTSVLALYFTVLFYISEQDFMKYRDYSPVYEVDERVIRN